MIRAVFSIVTVFLVQFLIISPSYSQKGPPPKPVVNITTTTNYAQHVDFKPSMVAQLKTEPGWKVSVAATGLGKPRMLCMNGDNQMYITRRDAGDVVLLTDLDGNNTFDELKTVVADFKGVHGIVIKDGWMYLCSNRELKRGQIIKDGMIGELEVLAKDLPDGGQHGNRVLRFGPDNMLYVSIGSTCNDCVDPNKENTTIVQINPQTWERKIFARGLRNTIGFDWSPADNEMYGVDNGADYKGDNWPPEELNKIQMNKDYGFPYAYGKQEVDETREDPNGITKAAFAKTTEPSIMEFPAHGAPIDFTFLKKGTALPADQQDDALVCWHGSWNKSKPDGFKVQRIKFENGKAVGTSDFLTGFLNNAQRTRFGRPAGLAVASTGAVYISDDANGIIYCVQPK